MDMYVCVCVCVCVCVSCQFGRSYSQFDNTKKDLDARLTESLSLYGLHTHTHAHTCARAETRARVKYVRASRVESSFRSVCNVISFPCLSLTLLISACV